MLGFKNDESLDLVYQGLVIKNIPPSAEFLSTFQTFC